MGEGGGRKVQEDNRERRRQAGEEALCRHKVQYYHPDHPAPGSKPVNKHGGTCYIPKDADLRLFVLPAYLFCMMAQFTRGKRDEAWRPDTTSNTTA